MVETLTKLFVRDLDVLTVELQSYNHEKTIWTTERMINNSAGTLSLHLCGNLQHFIGAIIGNTGFVRDRAGEFVKRSSLDDLVKEIDKTKSIVVNTLSSFPTYRLKDDYPIEVFGHKMTIEFFLVHLHGHLTYHLGQITYHRRLLDSISGENG